MQAFTFSTCQQIICEAGASGKLGTLCAEQALNPVLLITDPAIEALALHREALQSLEAVNIFVSVFAQVEADPPESIVHQAVAAAKKVQARAIIGFGGGSSMDVAKLVALLAHPNSTQALTELYGVNQARGERLPLIQIPTTAGTGSEVTPVAIITTGATSKMGAVSPLFLPDTAILDGALTVGLPPHITAATGLDAMVHAIEAFTSKIKKNPLSDMMAKEALRLLAGNIQTAVHNGNDTGAREAMLLGAMLAGQAFANAPVAAVHALAYPLGGHFHIPHGLSNSLVLPHVMRFNLPSAAPLYAELAPIMFPDETFSGAPEQVSETLITLIETLIDDLGLPKTLREMNIEASFLPRLAEDAMQQTRLLINNPREMTFASALDIYKTAY